MPEPKIQEMIDKAKTLGFWIRCDYQDIWFKPEELEALQRNGKYVWGVANFEIRNPQDKIKQLEEKISYSKRELQEFMDKL